MSRKTHDYREKAKAIRRILLAEWDPFGCGVPEDEYDSYITGIYRLIHERASLEGLAAHFRNLEKMAMGLEPDLEKSRRVAKSLLALMESD
ncbi:MAG TPA: DUF1871 family protein [Planctomycetaceae bacterium]|jgi:hypothetical protein|nr:DUF1871 family protein [Planctomycetaceae bacterium]